MSAHRQLHRPAQSLARLHGHQHGRHMSFNYILVAFATRGLPPDAKILNSTHAGLWFAPLTPSGSIYTVDRSIWHQGEIIPHDLTDSFCPQIEGIRSVVAFSFGVHAALADLVVLPPNWS
jgi:hypothetical protein